jgi:triacylglycerol lipase
MLARYLKLILLLLVACAAAVGAFLWGFFPPLALLGFVTITLSFSLLIGMQCAALTQVNRDDAAPRASRRQLMHAWWVETRTAANVFFWWQPFRSHIAPDNLPSGPQGTPVRGVLLVHGFICNRGLWTPWYPTLRRGKIPYLAVNLEPVFGSIDAYTTELDRAIRELHNATGMPPLVIAHSMGGVAVRAWLRACNGDARIHRVITIGSPHHGTKVGTALSHLSGIENAHQMGFDSAWLAALAAQESPERREKFVCFYSNCDNIVAPASSATLTGADNRHRAGIPHLALVLDVSIREQSLALL